MAGVARRSAAASPAPVAAAGGPGPTSAAPRGGKSKVPKINPAGLAALGVVAVGTAVGGQLSEVLAPVVAAFKQVPIPEFVLKWGHAAGMAAALVLMGGYGSYLGWQLRDPAASKELKAKARDLHPQILSKMLMVFSMGCFSGVLMMLLQGKPVMQSTHSKLALASLGLLAMQSFFRGQPQLRTVHAYMGSAIMGLLLMNAYYGLTLGLSL